MRRLTILLVLMLAAAPAAAQTLTTRDIIALTKAGLGEEVLLGLIEVHRSVFPVDADTLKSLKTAGVTEKVILAMVLSGRQEPVVPVVEPEPVAPTVARPAPPVVVIERETIRDQPYVREVAVPVAVPVYVPIRTHWPRTVHPVRPVEPVFWGFGGKLRPDAWQPSDSEIRRRPGPFQLDPPQRK
jgi:hypothetical protein